MTKTKKKDTEKLEVNEFDFKISKMEVTIIGTTPLIMHKWSAKASKAILDKQMRKTKVVEARNPTEEFLDCLYYTNEEKIFGFPVTGIKAAMVRAAKTHWQEKMTDVKGLFFIPGVMGIEATPLIKIAGKPQMKKDHVRIGNGAGEIRFRPQFTEWGATFNIEYCSLATSAEKILTYLQAAGFSVGIGDWRPERDGVYGCFRLATEDDVLPPYSTFDEIVAEHASPEAVA